MPRTFPSLLNRAKKIGFTFPVIWRGNGQWKTFDENKEILLIFAGAHAYISPRWYDKPAENVPTWNYQAIHVYGKPQIFAEKAELFDLLKKTIEKHEPQTGYDFESIQPEIVEKLVTEIVGFRIEIARFEAAFKLSQHRPEFHAGVINNLTENADENSLKIAEAMRRLS